MIALAHRLGIAVPTKPDLIASAAALAAVAVALLAAWLAGRYLGPKLARLWEKHAGSRAEGIAPRMCAMMRYFTSWLLLALTLRFYPWPPLASLLLGLLAAGAAALFVLNVVRGLHLSRWIALLLAAFVFVANLADAVGGLAPLAAALDDIGLTIGTRRLTLLTVIQVVVGLVVLYVIVRLANRLVGQSIKRTSGLDPAQQLLAQKLAAVTIVVIAFFIGIDLAGIDLTALAVFSGALGLAVGFGLQKTIGNLIAGIILLMDRSIKPGDVISVGESFGSVNKIGVRAVSIVTRDGKEYLIPNELLMTQEVVNWSYSTRDVRISIPIRIAYDCDVKLAQKLMIEAAASADRVLTTPKPAVWTTAFGESSIDHEIRVWIADPEAGIGSVRSAILNRLWELFKEHGIEVPYPQRDLRVREWPLPAGNDPSGSAPSSD